MLSFGLDPVEHPQHGLVGAAVQRAVERGGAGGDRRVRVDLRRADVAHRGGRAVLLVVGVQDEQHVERLRQPRVRLVLQLGHLEQHREEVGRVGQVVVRIDVRQAEVVPVGERGERRHLRDQPDRRHVALVLVVDVLRVGVERRQRADRRQQHPHRVRVVAEAVEELLDVLVDVGVHGDLVHPVVELVARRQLAVDQQVGDLEVGRLLAELLDRVAAVLEDAGGAVDVGDLAAAVRGVRVRRVVGHEAEVVLVDLDPAEVHRLDGPVDDLDLVGLARPVVGDRERVLRGGYPAAVLILRVCSSAMAVSSLDVVSRSLRAFCRTCRSEQAPGRRQRFLFQPPPKKREILPAAQVRARIRGRRAPAAAARRPPPR